MQDFVVVTGMVLKATPIGDYDRRVLLLTRERGKISAFAKGARRQNSRFMAATNPFCFGEFKLFEGRNSYNITEASISNYFAELREDFEGAYYGMYFLEIADYYARENNEDKVLLKLLYQSLRALLAVSLQNRLVRYIFELKAMAVEGEFPGLPTGGLYTESTVYAVEYILASSIEKLYTFTVTDQVLSELGKIAGECCRKVFDRPFHSLEILESL
ncbi:MAG: DNA repair protein RecO [Lachnospiraceae bacterium]|nr:DNA repair protein RecO [Lachnospiraceae bacterium]